MVCRHAYELSSSRSIDANTRADQQLGQLYELMQATTKLAEDEAEVERLEAKYKKSQEKR